MSAPEPEITQPAVQEPPQACTFRDYVGALIGGAVGALLIAIMYFWWFGISHSYPVALPIVGVVAGFGVGIGARGHRSVVLPVLGLLLGAAGIFAGFAAAAGLESRSGLLNMQLAWEEMDLVRWGQIVMGAGVAGFVAYATQSSGTTPTNPDAEKAPDTAPGEAATPPE